MAVSFGTDANRLPFEEAWKGWPAWSKAGFPEDSGRAKRAELSGCGKGLAFLRRITSLTGASGLMMPIAPLACR
jgi:hypothetical protein